LHQQNDCHQDLVLEGEWISSGVLGDNIENTAPNIKLIWIVLSILEVLPKSLFLQLREIIPHWIYNTENKKDLEDFFVAWNILDIDGIDVND